MHLPDFFVILEQSIGSADSGITQELNLMRKTSTRRLISQNRNGHTNCLSVFDRFARLGLKGMMSKKLKDFLLLRQCML